MTLRRVGDAATRNI